MSPRSPEQFALLRERSRQRILRSALALFARAGYERATVREIARDAGISQGLLYNYFSGKDDLLREIFLRGMEDVRGSFARAPAGAPPLERLDGLIHGSFEIVRANLEFWRLSYGLRMQPGVLEGLADEIRQWSGAIHHEIEGLLRDAGVADSSTEATLLFAQIDGAAQHFALDPDHYPIARVARAISDRYHALAAASPRVDAHPEPSHEH